jgi:atypical dual specificity phosphatase
MTQGSGLDLPKNFSWLEESKLAGSARPETEGELRAVKGLGIGAIVSLTGTPLIPTIVNNLGFDYLHSHISKTPSITQPHDIIQFIEEEYANSKPVLVHCAEGKGRTGTALAAYLVYHGLGANEAIERVREKRPGAIENSDQENAIRLFERTLRAERS